MSDIAIVARRSALAMTLAVFATSLGAHAASAQSAYPNHPVRLIVPYPPGGPTDVMARLVAQSLSEGLGQQVYVDNRPGGGATLAGKLAAGAEPDGYTLMVGSAAPLAIGPALYKDAGYDPRAFVPVASIAAVPFVMVAGPKAQFANVRDLVAYAKANPGKLTFGVPNGAPPHMLAVWFKSLTATDILIVPYKGASTEITDLIAGQIDLGIEPSSVVLAHLAEGSLRPLGTPSPRRLPELPNVPTMIESGIPEFVASSWTGIVGPPGTPKAIVDRVNAAVNAGLASADLKAKLKSLGAEGRPGTPEDFAAVIAREIPQWAKLAKLSGVNTD
jgi:tripartite-type tricarboxylate transporter receptor subunit TctC